MLAGGAVLPDRRRRRVHRRARARAQYALPRGIFTSSGRAVPAGCVSVDGVHFSYSGDPCHRVYAATGLPRTAYDAVRVTTWALVIVGVLLVVLGLIRYARQEVRQ